MICAELLLSGILAIHGKSPDISVDNDIIYRYPKVTYVVPDRYNIEQQPCKGEVILKKEGINMNKFLQKLD